MKALSIRQPWTWAILHAGKTIENRSWATDYRGPLLLHAAKGCTALEYEDGVEAIEDAVGHPVIVPKLAETIRNGVPGGDGPLERGGFVGIAQFVGVIPPYNRGEFVSPSADMAAAARLGIRLDHDAWRWHHPVQYGFVLAEVTPLPFLPWRGERGLFDVDIKKLREAEQRPAPREGWAKLLWGAP